MKTKKTAKESYRLHREVIDSYLRDIKAGLEAHAAEFKASGSKDWGYAGDLDRFEDDLRDISDALLKRGEYAPEDEALAATQKRVAAAMRTSTVTPMTETERLDFFKKLN